MSSFFDNPNVNKYGGRINDTLTKRGVSYKSVANSPKAAWDNAGDSLRTTVKGIVDKNLNFTADGKIHAKRNPQGLEEFMTGSIWGAKQALKPFIIELDILNPPPAVILLINPEELSMKYAVKITEYRVRWVDAKDSGYVFHAHHDELDAMSVSGKSAMFYDSEGLTSDNRENTAGWENMNQLVAMYRNNGLNFNRKVTQTNASMIDSVGSVLITYDTVVYRGYFQSFSIRENDSKQFNYDFSFEYKVTRNIPANNTSMSI